MWAVIVPGRSEKARMEEVLKQLEAQRKEFEERLLQMEPSQPKPKGPTQLSDFEITIAEKVINHWKGRRYVRMAEAVRSTIP